MSSTFWKLIAMGATAAAAVVVAKEVVERNERGDDCSPVEVIKGIGRKIGVLCGCKDCENDEDFFDDFDEFEFDEDGDSFDFDTADMDGDELTADGYIVEFNAEPETENEQNLSENADEQEADSKAEAAPAADAKPVEEKDSAEETEKAEKSDKKDK